MYEVAGESVIPGIDCQNVESIFEEHTLCSQLDPLAAQHNVYAITERKFDFGAVLAAVGGGAPHPGVKANLKFTNVFKVGDFWFFLDMTLPLSRIGADLTKLWLFHCQV